MPGHLCSLHIRQDAVAATLRIEGRITMNQCPSVRCWADRSLDAGAQDLRVDLSGCTYMDSTFVGTLLGLYRRCKCRGAGGLILLAPSLPCRQVLEQMHLHEIFNVVDQPDTETDGWTELPPAAEEPSAMLNQVVSAHQELATLPGEVGKNFRGIAEELTSEMRKAK